MSVDHVHVIVEEPSMEAALRLLLPKILGEVSFEIYQHQCKSELLARLPQRLKGYATWLRDSHRILVVVDRDDDDCADLKQQLEEMARKAGLTTKTASKVARYQVVNRVAIEELEAWYFGDWQAVRTAYRRVKAAVPSRVPYRKPDEIKGGTWEAFERELQNVGYFNAGLRKIEAARAVAEHMVPARNTSPSFRALRDVLTDMTRS